MNKNALRYLNIAVLLAACVSWIPSHAAELGFYVAGSYGNSSKDIEKGAFDNFAAAVYDDFQYTPTSSTTSFDSDGHGYSFAAGYRLYSWLAVEGGYIDLGRQPYRARNEGFYEPLNPGDLPEFSPFVLSASPKTGGFALSALGIVPLSYRWEAFGRVGVMFSSNELTLYLSDSTGALKQKTSDSSTDLLAGAGVSFAFAEIYGLRAEYLRVFDAGDNTVGEADTDLITLGITVKF